MGKRGHSEEANSLGVGPGISGVRRANRSGESERKRRTARLIRTLLSAIGVATKTLYKLEIITRG